MSRPGWFLRAGALAAAAIIVSAPRLASQDGPAPRRLKLVDTGLPAIDLGPSPGARLEAIGGRVRPAAAGCARRRPRPRRRG